MAYRDLDTAQRILLGPGSSIVSPRVLRAVAHPLVGHLDPQFIELMSEIQEMLLTDQAHRTASDGGKKPAGISLVPQLKTL